MDQRAESAEVVILGGGLSALRAALAARSAGADVLMLSKGPPGRSGNTVVASAGIGAVLEALSAGDSPEQYMADVLRAGHFLNDPELVRVLAEESGRRVAELTGYGVQMQMVDGQLDRIKAPGHSRPRTYRPEPPAYGHKGLALATPLYGAVRAAGVRIREGCSAVSLCRDGGFVSGIAAVDLREQNLLTVRAGAVVVATGGGAYLYQRTNGTRGVCGDGIGLALRAGAAVRDMEFVQFHPTRTDRPIPLFLTGALLADGAVLRDRQGREFMYDYHPSGSTAPRDFMGRAIFLEVQKGNGVDGGVYLDCSGVEPDRIQLRHRKVFAALAQKGLDLTRDWVVVSPAAHFFMGGIVIDLHGATEVPGLYAAGEVTGGLHGANRLGRAAFAEALVFGARAGQAAARFAREAGGAATPAPHPVLPYLAAGAQPVQGVLKEYWARLREQMWQGAGISRDAAGLRGALAVTTDMMAELGRLTAPDVAGAAGIMELTLALEAARAVCIAALNRAESRGAHWRADFPALDQAWRGNQLQRLQDDGQLDTAFRPAPALSAPGRDT